MTDDFIKRQKIAPFAIANAVTPSKFQAGVAHFTQVTGFQVIEPEEIPSGPRHFAGTDQARAEHFNRLLEIPGLTGVVAIRGGYGVTRILERIDFELLRRKECFVCGYSDITALLLVAWKHGCRKLLHGPMFESSWSADPLTPMFVGEAASFLFALETIDSGTPFEIHSPTARTLRSGGASGTLIPMNLTLLCALLGTPFMPDLSGAILALEDVAEPAHDIDRNLNHLRQAGVLKGLAGLVFGSFTNAQDAEFIPEILAEYALEIHGPVLADFPFGHGHPAQTLPFGYPATLSAK